MDDIDKKFMGEVIFFDSKKGYGFILQRDNKPDLFVHFSDIQSEGFKTLYKGQKVSYNMGENRRGEPKAIDVLVLKQ